MKPSAVLSHNLIATQLVGKGICETKAHVSYSSMILVDIKVMHPRGFCFSYHTFFKLPMQSKKARGTLPLTRSEHHDKSKNSSAE